MGSSKLGRPNPLMRGLLIPGSPSSAYTPTSVGRLEPRAVLPFDRGTVEQPREARGGAQVAHRLATAADGGDETPLGLVRSNDGRGGWKAAVDFR